METMGIEKLRDFEPLNEIEQAHVDSMKAAMLAGTFQCPPVLVWLDRNELVTGSHRVVACDQLYREANMSKNVDLPEYIAVMDLQIPVIDVSELLADVDADEFQYDNLSKYFRGSEIEEFVKENKEW